MLSTYTIFIILVNILSVLLQIIARKRDLQNLYCMAAMYVVWTLTPW